MKLIQSKGLVRFCALLGFAALSSTGFAQQSELDDVVTRPVNVPHGLVVRVENKTRKTEVFTADVDVKTVKDAETAKVVTEKIVADANKVKVQKGAEIDEVKSQSAWCFWYRPTFNFFPYYSYYHFGVNYFYQPVNYFWTTPAYTYYYYTPNCYYGGFYNWNYCW